MPNTSRLAWPYPDEQSNPWFDKFASMIEAQDATGYANREDRSLVIGNGGTFSWNSGTNVLTWTDAIELISSISGYRLSIAAGSATITPGQFLYVNLTRAPLGSATLTPLVANHVPNTDDAYVIAVNVAGVLYLRNGQKFNNGDSKPFIGGGSGSSLGTTGQKFINIVGYAARVTHDSTTPRVVAAFAINPSLYAIAGTTMTAEFTVVAANGDVAMTTHAKLFNLTDSDNISVLNFTSTSTAKAAATIAIGSGAGQIDNSEKIYEVHIYLDVPPGGPTNTIELYSAEVKIINTIT